VLLSIGYMVSRGLVHLCPVCVRRG